MVEKEIRDARRNKRKQKHVSKRKGRLGQTELVKENKLISFYL